MSIVNYMLPIKIFTRVGYLAKESEDEHLNFVKDHHKENNPIIGLDLQVSRKLNESLTDKPISTSIPLPFTLCFLLVTTLTLNLQVNFI